MHHTLRLYAQHQDKLLRLYIFLAKLTAVPLLGRLIRSMANSYGRSGHNGYLLTLAQAEGMIDAANKVALGPCSCRRVFHNCDAPIMAEIVLSRAVEAFAQIRPGELQEISKEEAKSVLRQCREKRLMHTVMRCRENLYAICSCCSCCCVPTRLRQKYGIAHALVRKEQVVADFYSQWL